MSDDVDAYKIDDFCKRHGFSRGTYYNLLKAGKAPKFITIGSRRFITREAAEQWRREREAAAGAEYEEGLSRHRAARAKGIGTHGQSAEDQTQSPARTRNRKAAG